jgi:hypothetical protein
MSAITHTRSAVAVAARRHKRTPSTQTSRELAEARTELAAAKLEAYISRVVESAPPLSLAQRERIAQLVNKVGGA